MLTNNYKKCMLFGQSGGSLSMYLTNKNGSNTTYSVGANVNLLYGLTGGKNQTSGIDNMNAGYSRLDIGFGDTPESASDYILADGNNENALLTVVSSNRNTGAIGEIINIFLNVRNDGAANVTVKEVGYYANPLNSSTGGGNTTCLFSRKVLETPVTIAPGETYSFNYVLKFRN